MNDDEYKSLLASLPHNPVIFDGFVKAHSMICTDKFNRIVCSVSGGSDSDLLVDICSRLSNKNIEYVFFDTGLEYQATKEHLDYLEERYGISIKRIRAKYPVPLAVKKVGQPFISKQVSEYISRLQRNNFKWEDKSFDELYQEYPMCKSALKWWCNYKGADEASSMFNINRNKWLKEFLIENPPCFDISPRCCDLAKKMTGSQVDSKDSLHLVGVRKSEGGVRASHNTCVTYGHRNIYRPIFWYSDEDKEQYEEFSNIKHSLCYSKYGLKRTGCAGCPFGREFEFELEVLEKYEPKLHKAVCNIFKESYEYTRKYREFCKEKNKEIEITKGCYQTSIFDYLEGENKCKDK